MVAPLWELDAIPPRELQRLITSAVEQRLDLDFMQAVVRREAEIKTKLQVAAEAVEEEEEEVLDDDAT